jgi:alpha-glucosidase
MNRTSSIFIACALCVATCFSLPAKNVPVKPLSVSSPDGNLTVSFALKTNPQPYLPGERAYYRVSFKGKQILTDSPLGLDFLAADPLDNDFEITQTQRLSHDSVWENPFGPKREIPDHYNQLKISVKERHVPGRRVDLIFRAYNEGVALRYFLPSQEHLTKFALSSENTGFYFDHNPLAYALNMGRFNTHNEGEYSRMKLSDIKPAAIINLPLLIEVPGGPWVTLLEADLADYAGMYVGGVPGIKNALTVKLSYPPRKESIARNITTTEYQMMEKPVVGTTPKATPWRVLMIAQEPGRLIETNYLILNLNPPCALTDPSWIKPGKTAWDWWSGSYAANVDFAPGMNTQTMEHYIDFAAAHHLESMLIDGGWYMGTSVPDSDDILKSIPEVDMPHILAHAKQKGVNVILWVDWHPLESHLDEALALYEKWGVTGIKIDGMNRDDQGMVNLTAKWVRKAAEYHLTVDLHGAYKPTGLQRTYPNLLTVEGVMGMEYNKWSERVTPEYTTTIPFTRMLAGPMDFTPGSFHNTVRGQFIAQDIAPMSLGTRANQLAMYVVYESPLAMVSDYPEAYENQPGIEFIEKVPTVWDDTKVINGKPSMYVTIARRSGENWYIGAMTNWDSRDLEIPLSFLKSGEYKAQVFADGPDADKTATSLVVSKKQVTAAERLHLHLAPGGGSAIILSPVVK